MRAKTSIFLLIYSGITLLLMHSLNCEPIVEINNNQISGQNVKFQNFGVHQYLGIPYAQPPVGPLRFMPTVPLLQQPRMLKAIVPPPACMQYTERPFPWYVNSSEKSEDCLYLNIWTPSDASPENKKAVMYWIPGGGFRHGSIRSELYNGTALSALGDVIVVTVNYRLGPFGFLFSGTDDAPGNAGLWDVLEGLRWVNKNIGFFGGDISRITISGESAGSIFVGMLSVSPLTKGLYSKQIMESGSPTYLQGDLFREKNLDSSQKVAEIARCANDTCTIQDNPRAVVECLKSVDPMVLSKADFLALPDSGAFFFPQHGDEIVPDNPRIAILKGNFRCTDTLIGNTNDEGSFALTTKNPEIFGFFGEKNHQINKTTGADLMRQMLKGFPDPESAIKHYLHGPENAYSIMRYRVYTSYGDGFFLCPDVYYAEKCAEKGNNVYFFMWKHRPSGTPWALWMGDTHFSDVQFVFGRPLLHPSSYQEEEVQLSQKVIGIWSNFVKTGKPSADWPLFSRESPIFKYLGPGNSVDINGSGPHQSECEFYRPFFTPK
ncbi:acetylcholinesterase-1 [Nephila pilipes]|uniref:Carboxylic ester hydrolase n=1 Tax=Nephila pilipes TaxID=299642 RepID=A0A8X6TKU1_NEPPI|nr:acetylcholinesterase-1 [Nephila pilipes]